MINWRPFSPSISLPFLSPVCNSKLRPISHLPSPIPHLQFLPTSITTYHNSSHFLFSLQQRESLTTYLPKVVSHLTVRLTYCRLHQKVFPSRLFSLPSYTFFTHSLPIPPAFPIPHSPFPIPFLTLLSTST